MLGAVHYFRKFLGIKSELVTQQVRVSEKQNQIKNEIYFYMVIKKKDYALYIYFNLLFQTTFILKRKWEPLLHKKNQKPRKLRAKHFVYDLVEDTLIKKSKQLEVVLTTFVEGVGDKGDIVSLKPQYAYNNLLLPGLAVYKTDENIKKYQKTEEDKRTILHSSPFAQRVCSIQFNT